MATATTPRPETPTPLDADAAAPEARLSVDDARVAVKSAFTLGASLVATWSVALLVRLFLPRYLGPERFGTFNFADSFAATFAVLYGLGVETYIQKEIPVRPEYASRFFGGFILLRAVMTAGIFAAMALVMMLTGRPPSVLRVVFIFGAAQLLVTSNVSLAALLQAARSVGGLATVNVGAKVLWGAGVVFAVVAHQGLEGLALAFLVAEAVRSIFLATLARRELGLQLIWDGAAVKTVIAASLPFYLSQMANTVYAKIDVSLLAVLSNDLEVGWYGSAANLAGLSMLISPLIGWVLLPLLSRAAARSEAELFVILRRAMEAILMGALPIALFMGLGADVWIHVLFGAAFAPAVGSLALLAPIFVLTYLAMISATCLVLLDRAWRVTVISLVGLVANLLLNFALVPPAMRHLGPGGGGAGASIALLITELGVSVALTAAIGRRAFDRASVAAIGKSVLACVVVIVADVALRPLGPARLLIDAVAYVALIFASGAVRTEEAKRMARFLLRKHRPSASA